MVPRALFFCAVGFGAVFFIAGRMAMRITPAQIPLGTQITGTFTEGKGWYPGEPFPTSRPVRAWGSWVGADENTGELRLGPFPAATRLRFAVSGYPNNVGIQLYVERDATKE